MKPNHYPKTIALFSLVVAVVAALSLTSQPAAAEDKGISSKDQTFVTNAAEGGLAEVKMGKLGKEKATSAEVKSLAEMLVTDHTKANAKLEKIATARGAKVPKSTGSVQEANYLLLKARSGDSFDAAFAEQSVKDHQTTIELFEKEAKEGDDPALKSFAEKTLPTLKEHLSMSQRAAAATSKKTSKS